MLKLEQLMNQYVIKHDFSMSSLDIAVNRMILCNNVNLSVLFTNENDV